MEQLIKVLIYDDKDDLRETLTLLIDNEPGFEVVGAFNNCETAPEDIRILTPDVVLMDIDMPAMTGVAGVHKIRQSNQAVRIIMLTVFEDNQNIFEALKAGANGYILKKTAPDRLLDHIREVAAGGSPMTASVATKILEMFVQTNNTAKKEYDLSEREREVLRLLVEGNSYKTVAAQLNIAVDTVRTHVRNIYEKLHVNSKAEAVAKALKNRIV